MEDEKYRSKKVDIFLLDELAHWQDPNINYDKYWKAVKGEKKHPKK